MGQYQIRISQQISKNWRAIMVSQSSVESEFGSEPCAKKTDRGPHCEWCPSPILSTLQTFCYLDTTNLSRWEILFLKQVWNTENRRTAWSRLQRFKKVMMALLIFAPAGIQGKEMSVWASIFFITTLETMEIEKKHETKVRKVCFFCSRSL